MSRLLCTGTLWLLVFVALLRSGSAQPPTSPAGSGPTGSAAGPHVPVFVAVGLGDQVDLDKGWLFHPGDDPSYASSRLDDRQWLAVDLHRNLESYGFTGLRYGWLRLHLRLPTGAADDNLGIRRSLGRFEVFANGRKIGSFGNMDRHDLYDNATITQFPLPSGARVADGSQELVLALRLSLQKTTYEGGSFASPLQLDDITVLTIVVASVHAVDPQLREPALLPA